MGLDCAELLFLYSRKRPQTKGVCLGIENDRFAGQAIVPIRNPEQRIVSSQKFSVGTLGGR